MNADELTPTVRAALLAALDSPGHCLRRGRGGFVAIGAVHIRTSKPCAMQAFTRRVVNWLERDGLVEFDDSLFPTYVTLTPEGVEVARELQINLRGVAA